LLDGLKLVESLDHTIEIERHVFMDDDVAEARKPLEFPNQLRRETLIPRQVSNGFRVVFVAVSSPRGKLSGDIDDELAHGEKREQNVVSQRQIALERLPPRHPRTDRPQVIQIAAKLGKPLDEVVISSSFL
jgi:hypothetical protein